MFSCNNTEVACLPNYGAAERHFKKHKPWRGDSPYEVPLGNRRHKHKRLVKYDTYYAARLYDTDVVKIHQDDSLTLYMGGYDTHFTLDFMRRVLPVSMSVYTVRGKVWVRARNRAGEYAEYYLPTDRPLHFIDGQPTEIHPVYKQRINRAAAKEVREFHRELRSLFTIYTAANPTVNLNQRRDFRLFGGVQTQAMVDDPASWAVLFDWLLFKTVNYSFAYSGHPSERRPYNSTLAMRKLDALLFRKHPHVFDQVPLPQGPVAGA